ncbi:MAG: hypothetical protein IPJ65_03110 [Archangiaceae bacterium]|nr:hypothetical protein [Archangiaceae bacterium]
MSAFALLLSLAAAPVAPAAEPEDREPALLLYFEAEGGKRVPVELDKPFNPTELGKSAALKVEPQRRFSFAGLEFRYPREYGFEAQLEAQFASWTLSGNDTKVLVQRYKNQKKLDAMHKGVIAEIHKAYGGKAKESPTTLVAGGKTLEGTRLEVELASALIVQDLFPVKSGNDALELIIQDSPKKAGEPSAERVRTQRLLEDTLKLPK